MSTVPSAVEMSKRLTAADDSIVFLPCPVIEAILASARAVHFAGLYRNTSR
jgi:hypothetical protein